MKITNEDVRKYYYKVEIFRKEIFDMNQNPNNQNNPNEKKNGWVKWAILGALIVIIIILLLRGCSGVPGGNDNININIGGGGGSELVVDPNAGEYVEPEKEGPTKGVAIPGWGTITIPANKAEGIVVDFYNPASNEGLYYLTFELRLPNDSPEGYEVLYKSGLVEPDKHIQKINLNHGLAEGTYDAIIHVQPYRMDENKTPTNNADMKTTIVVK